MALRIREARPEDAPALHALLHAAYAAREGPQGERPLLDTLDDVRGIIEEGLVLVGENAEGRLVSCVHLRRVAEVRRLAVAPEAAREGLGGQMLEEALGRAEALGHGVAMLDTIPTHPWLPEFYRRHGFAERCVERFPDGRDWLQLRRKLRR